MALRQLPEDRQCRPGALDNPFRRYFLPARREIDLLTVEPGMTVADLGSGVGYLLPEIGRKVGPNGRIYAVDIDGENLQQARQRAVGTRLEIHQRSAASVPEIPSGSVDRAVLSLVLCCMVDKEAALDTAWRILRPGGRVLVSYPRGRGGPRRRSRSLAVSPARWSSLLARHPWTELPRPRSWLVHRHLLQRPREG
ncbi:MAG: class I SAM-dependent methyltransferase [Thermoplasmata archaeon]